MKNEKRSFNLGNKERSGQNTVQTACDGHQEVRRMVGDTQENRNGQREPSCSGKI